VKTDAALSWKGLSLSAVLHGSAFAAAGLVLLHPAQVGTQEAPVTAEFQVFSQTPPDSTSPSATASEASVADSTVINETHDKMPLDDLREEMSLNETANEAALPLPMQKERAAADPIPAGTSPKVSTPNPSRLPRRSVPHSVSAATSSGAKNVLPDYLSNPPPRYPESSRLGGEQGVVLVRVDVACSGNVNRVLLARSSGYHALDRAAVEAVKRWKFHPASAAGIAMNSEVTVPVRFELHEGKEGVIGNP
jgi:TonB family protein